MRIEMIWLLIFLGVHAMCSVSTAYTETVPTEAELLDHLYVLKLFQAHQDYGDYEDSEFKKEKQLKRKYPYILKRQTRIGKSRRPYILKRNSVFLMN
ncbi:uncharacterized protein nts [Stegostoma tigrinum]|uniref:uncharacterized protein nts n=1 Tax=Stegostoma tigrinum TaxID=3053191 RepID=UPI00202B8763|nr:uncharacterized protein nts [Stegostoma tigrinum]